MELLSLENINRQIAEMWDAISQIPASDPDKQEAFDQAAKSDNSLREAYRKQEALRDAAPELLEALKFMVEHCAVDLWSDKRQEINGIIAKAEGRE
jgi:hypothetical protein